MKCAFYLADGLTQVVLTPETKAETAILDTLHDGLREITVCKGQFAETRGGWLRDFGIERPHDNHSTMLVLRPAAPKPAEVTPAETSHGQ
ncbi:hypothetical protein ASG52_19715 [Methylobacterium sp. Leaf456]|uniref:hypothetical protein n=1 Tax=Methylobacterium sp. Leaf456 TaxID=1736382 RepID=UPI0006F9DA18|nr:hypothetical protein [Methylobacterium sp. Leaf456]KQT59955.1 hypothetical protein ASG52_19715 [Methylobacterium sp. Leaf456]